MNKIAKLLKILAIFNLLSAPVFVLAEEYPNEDGVVQYIKDEAPAIPARVFASNNAKVSFYLNNGERVYSVETSPDGDFIKINNDKGKTGWIKANLLQSTATLRFKSDALAQEVAQLKQRLNNKGTATSVTEASLIEENQQLVSKNEELTNLLQQQQETIDGLSVGDDKKKQDEILKWFTRGGMVAGAGFIIGIILPLIWPRRRDRYRW